MTRINQKEYWFLKRLDDKWKWIARDRDSLLYVFNTKPGKGKIYAVWSIEDGEDHDYWEIENKDLFQFIQWSDSEPYNIAELIRGYEWAQLNEKYPPVGEREETEAKRDKEDLVKYLEKEISNFKPGEMIYDYLTFILKQLKQLGGSERIEETTHLLESVLKENKRLGELLEEKHEEWLELMDEINNRETLSKKELPVIPQWVADNIESKKRAGVRLNVAMSEFQESKLEKELDIDEYECNEIYARAWLDGYTAEEEQKYIVKLPLHGDKANDFAVVDIYGDIWLDDEWPSHCKMTEKEIKALPKGEVYFEHFAIKVEEMEE